MYNVAIIDKITAEQFPSQISQHELSFILHWENCECVLYFGSPWLWVPCLLNSTLREERTKGKRDTLLLLTASLSSRPLVNQWLILPRGASFKTWMLCWTILGSVMWSSLTSHELAQWLHIINYASLCLDVSRWYCLKSPAISCGRQNGCCVKLISVR